MGSNLARILGATGCLTATLLGGTRAGADDETAGKTPLLEMRWIAVGALTHPRPTFVPDRGPKLARAEDVSDVADPMFGGEGEEGTRAYGTIDELIDLVRGRISAAAWEEEGAHISAMGTNRLVLRGSRTLLDAVSRAVADLEREALSFVTMDVIALEGDGAVAASDRGVEAGLRAGTLRVVAAARGSAVSGQRVALLSGGERAYLLDHDVEVAEEASTSDPVVGVLNEGLCADLRPTYAGGELRIELRAWMSTLDGLQVRETAEGDVVEVPAVKARETRSPMLKLVPGAWSYLAASRDFGFAVRATVKTASPQPAGVTLPHVPRTVPAGAFSTTMIDVGDFAVRNAQTRATRLYLPASKYTAPEPPELCEPTPLFDENALVDTLKVSVDPESWETEGTSLELRNHRLVVRTDAAHVEGIHRVLSALRQAFVRSYRAKATLVSLPVASFGEFATGLDDGAELLLDGGAALLARPGAKVEERVSVRLLDAGRTGVDQGTLRRWVGDYDVEIAKKAAIGNPRVFGILEGTTFDAAMDVTSDGQALVIDLRLDRSTWREVRKTRTRHGELELPAIGLQRVRGSYLVALGSTRLVGLSIEGDRAVLLLLTAGAE